VAKRSLSRTRETAISISSVTQKLCAIPPRFCGGRSRRHSSAATVPHRARRWAGTGGGHRSQRQRRTLLPFAVRNMHVDAVQVIPRFFGEDGEFGFCRTAGRQTGPGLEVRLIFRGGHHGKSFAWQRRERELDRPAPNRQAPRGVSWSQTDQRTVGQLAHDSLQAGCRYGWSHRRVH